MNNTLIKASAGTGKTFALTTHIIRLMLCGTPSHALIALTFSRASAGEIFNRVAKRLAEAAASDEGASSETTVVMREIDPAWRKTIYQRYEVDDRDRCSANAPSLTPKCFAALLYDFIHTQHISRIGTIDSFMTQMVALFPVELGLLGPMTILDAYERARQQTAATDALLTEKTTTSDEIKDILEISRQATDGHHCKTFFIILNDFITRYHDIYLNNPQAEIWSDPKKIWGPTGLPFASDETLSDLADKVNSTLLQSLDDTDKRRKGWQETCDFLRRFNGTFTAMPTPLKNLLAAWDGKSHIAEFNCNAKKTQLTTEETALMVTVARALFYQALRIRCERTQGIYRWINHLETIYARQTRQRGLLTFADILRLINRLEDVPRLNLEYRLDSELQHWALDEFQDTSRPQWNAISNLINEAKLDDQRTVFVVGDPKQAVYGWRGGTVEIFEEELNSSFYTVCNLLASYRYSPEIATFINRVFNADAITQFLKGSRAERAAEKWSLLWGTHTSAVKTPGFVSVQCVEGSTKGTEDERLSPFIGPICEELLRIKPCERGITTALLVRTNREGECFAEALRHAGIPALWEGESDIADTPVVQAFLNLLHVVEHPDDTRAWQHLRATPLLSAPTLKCPKDRSPEHHLAHVIKQVTNDVSRFGLARALRNYMEALDATMDSFTRTRMASLVRAAAQFEASSEPDISLSDFATFVRSFKTRTAADATVVKILTIHRAKGLGFDYVILPVIERKSMTALSNGPLFAADHSWVLDQSPVQAIVDKDPTLTAASDATRINSVFEQLCVFYVSMTRAKRAMSVFVSSTDHDFYFSKHVTATFTPAPVFTIGHALWYEDSSYSAPEQAIEETITQHYPCHPRHVIRRATPSTLPHEGICAASLFDVHDSVAAERGTAIHELLSQIEWLDNTPEQAILYAACQELGVDVVSPSPFREALTRPTEGATVWRERSFEMLQDDLWTSGTIDRVVFWEQHGMQYAIIYDYKSNRKRQNEDPQTFTSRMRESYAPQLAAYRQAIASLSGLPDCRITTRLLLTETLDCIEVTPST